MACVIAWFRRDFRLADNPALMAAAQSGHPVLAVYIHDPAAEGDWAPGAASNWWRHHSLTALRASLAELGLPLVIRRGPAGDALAAVIHEAGAVAVHWNRLYEPALIERDKAIKASLRERGIGAHSHNAALLHEPWTVSTGGGTAYRAFTPFWRACQRQHPPAQPLGIPEPAAAPTIAGLSVDDLGLLPRIRWDGGLAAAWQPGEAGADQRLNSFLRKGLADYGSARDWPAVDGTSGLSPHLHFGEIGPRQVWAATQRMIGGAGEATQGSAEAFLAEIGWREFAHHVLYHHPDFPDQPLNPRFANFPWRDDPESLLTAWQQGRTGFPIVDAGMRQLWETGWMHNRVRMVVGSLLVKNARIPWQRGERWFWDTLVDADLASNSLGWQWVAGSGADAAPFFRIFNPVRQGERFDPEGAYVAHWVPEIAALPARHRHAPWQAPAKALREAGLTLGQHYPRPVLDLQASRKEALEAFEHVKND
jgi:deoxyribodipyrimidine photo-lyase